MPRPFGFFIAMPVIVRHGMHSKERPPANGDILAAHDVHGQWKSPMYKVFVDGQEGTTGLQIHELLARRNDVEVLRIAPGLRKDAAERARLLNAADVAFL